MNALSCRETCPWNMWSSLWFRFCVAAFGSSVNTARTRRSSWSHRGGPRHAVVNSFVDNLRVFFNSEPGWFFQVTGDGEPNVEQHIRVSWLKPDHCLKHTNENFPREKLRKLYISLFLPPERYSQKISKVKKQFLFPTIYAAHLSMSKPEDVQNKHKTTTNATSIYVPVHTSA